MHTARGVFPHTLGKRNVQLPPFASAWRPASVIRTWATSIEQFERAAGVGLGAAAGARQRVRRHAARKAPRAAGAAAIDRVAARLLVVADVRHVCAFRQYAVLRVPRADRELPGGVDIRRSRMCVETHC
jgi:hypothetical protein